MNDQQTMFYLGYLCGLIDGEGTITIEKSKRKNRNLEMYPLICISNSNNKIVKIVTDIYNYFDIKYYVFWSKSSSRKGYAPNALIRVSGNSRVFKLLKLIDNNLICKKEQLNVVMEFIKSRDYGKSRKPYNEFELNLLSDIRCLNLKPSVSNRIE